MSNNHPNNVSAIDAVSKPSNPYASKMADMRAETEIKMAKELAAKKLAEKGGGVGVSTVANNSNSLTDVSRGNNAGDNKQLNVGTSITDRSVTENKGTHTTTDGIQISATASHVSSASSADQGGDQSDNSESGGQEKMISFAQFFKSGKKESFSSDTGNKSLDREVNIAASAYNRAGIQLDEHLMNTMEGMVKDDKEALKGVAEKLNNNKK